MDSHPEYKRHKEYSSKKNFAFGEAHNSLSKDELELIHKYGHWLCALANGDLIPITEEQKRFIKVCKGEENAITTFEVAWVKYLQSKEERRQRQTEQNDRDYQFGLKIKNLTDPDLESLFKQNLSPVERAYIENEWRRRFPPAGNVVHATTDGQ